MTSLSIRTEKEIIEELDRLANLQNVDRTTIVRKILQRGIEEEKLELGIALYLKGESIGRAIDISQCSLWDLLDEFKNKGITKRFDLEAEKEIILKTFVKNDSNLANKIRDFK